MADNTILSFTTSYFLLFLTFPALYLIYSWALPRPLPGIPYDESAVRSLLGSMGEIREFKRRTGRIRPWVTGHPRRHNSPLTQVWLGPMTKPCLILTNFHESQDILLRRNREFDRAKRSLDIFVGLTPNHHIAMRTSDPRFRANKDLVRDLMTPSFLKQVSAPQIYDKVQTLVDLWTIKSELADGRPFDARLDIHDAAMDMINGATFALGEDMSVLRRQLELLLANNRKATSSISPTTGAAVFPRPLSLLPPQLAALKRLGEHQGEQFKSLLPRTHHWWKMATNNRGLADAVAVKEEWIREEIEGALIRLRGADWAEADVRSAMDHVLKREMMASEKRKSKGEERWEPDFHSRRIYDELYGYIGAGHDTTSTALAWMVKHLSQNQQTQSRLRNSLFAAFPRDSKAAPAAAPPPPTASEIQQANLPHLDAFLEESLRVSAPLPMTQREAVIDGATVLGHPVPRGTEVFILMSGPGYVSPEITVDTEEVAVEGGGGGEGREEKEKTTASPNGTTTALRHGSWDPGDIHLFKPERWLVTASSSADDNTSNSRSEEGTTTTTTTTFNPRAGPMLSFGLGPRGCFGRRLAMLETRLVIASLVWHFRFLPLTNGESEDDDEDDDDDQDNDDEKKKKKDDWDGTELGSNDVNDGITADPRRCFVRLERVR